MSLLRGPLRELFPPAPTDDMPIAIANRLAMIQRAHGAKRVVGAVVNVFYYACLAVLAVFLSWIIAQVLDRTPPTVVMDAIETHDVSLGGDLVVEITIKEKHRSCDLQLRYFIFDGAREIHVYELEPIPASGLITAERPFRRKFHVPVNLNPGEATFRLQRDWACPGNFVHRWGYPIVASSPPMPFRILPQAPP